MAERNERTRPTPYSRPAAAKQIPRPVGEPNLRTKIRSLLDSVGREITSVETLIDSMENRLRDRNVHGAEIEEWLNDLKEVLLGLQVMKVDIRLLHKDANNYKPSGKM